MTGPTLQEKYEAEIARLDEEHEELTRLWTQVPWFFVVAALSPVVGYVWGWGAALVELLVTAALVGTRAYLVAVRQTENRWNRGKLVNDLNEHLAEPSREVLPVRKAAPAHGALGHAQSAA